MAETLPEPSKTDTSSCERAHSPREVTSLGIAAFRREMPVVKNWAYFDHAAVAPLSGPAARVIAQWAQVAAEQGDIPWLDWAEAVEGVRRTVATALNASPGEIALVPNTTAGIQIVAQGFPWREGDNVVVPENEFPSNLYPWMALAERKVETRRVPAPGGRVEIDRLVDACDERTRIVSCSWVGYASGWRIDPAELVTKVHERGALVFLDAIQGLGVFPLDVRRTGIDFLAADGHKWMLGPEGAGVFFSSQTALEQLGPVGAGWNSVVGRYDFSRIEWKPRPEAARFEGGSQNMVGMLALGGSLDLLSRMGWGPTKSSIADQVLASANELRRRLEAIGARPLYDAREEHRSGIVTFDVPGAEPMAIRDACKAAGVVVSVRGGGVRASVHGYNDASDLERLIDAVRAAISATQLSTRSP